MKIFYIGYPLRDEAAPHQAMAALHLAKEGFDVLYVAWANGDAPAWLLNYPSLRYEIFPKGGIFSSLRWLIQLLRLNQALNWDVVYVQGAQQTPFLLWLPFLKKKATSIYHTQDYLEPGKYKFYEFFERLFARSADLVISNEANRARYMSTNYGLKCFPEVIRTALPTWWNFPERDEAYKRQFLEEAKLTHLRQPCLVVAGGCFSEERMSPHLIEAFGKLPEHYILIFTGMEPHTPAAKTLDDYLNKYSLDRRRVLSLARISYHNLLKLYSICDIGILLYPNSGIGHFYQAPGRLTEYLRAGLAIVASNFPGLELLTIKYDLGKVADPYSPEAIAKAIHDLGAISEDDALSRRTRLKAVALNDLAYEVQAEPVFKKIFSALPMQ